MEKQKEKPKYNLFQNSAYMIGRAWKHTPSVLWIILAIIAVTVLQSLAGLYIAPVVLEKVEAHAKLSELLRTIGLFAGALLLLSAADGCTCLSPPDGSEGASGVAGSEGVSPPPGTGSVFGVFLSST